MWRPPATSWTRVTTKNSDVLAPLTSRSLSSSLLAPKTFTNWRRQSLCFPNQTFAITPEVRPLLPDQSNESIQCKDYLRRDLDAYEFQTKERTPLRGNRGCARCVTIRSEVLCGKQDLGALVFDGFEMWHSACPRDCA